MCLTVFVFSVPINFYWEFSLIFYSDTNCWGKKFFFSPSKWSYFFIGSKGSTVKCQKLLTLISLILPTMERGKSHLSWVSSPCNLHFSCNILFLLHLCTFHSPVKAHCVSSQVVGPPGAYNLHEKMIHTLNVELERAGWEEDGLENKKGSRCGNWSQKWEQLWWKGVDLLWSMRSLNGIKTRYHQGDTCEINVGKPSQSIKQSHLTKEDDVLICGELTDRLWWTYCAGQGIRLAHSSPSSLVWQMDTLGVCRKYTLVRTVITRDNFKETQKLS